MPDALDAIRALRSASLADPEPVAALRARTARRRRRRRAVLLPLVAVGLVAGGLLAAELGDEDRRGELVTVDDPTTTTTRAAITTVPSATTEVGVAPVTPAGADRLVLSGRDGIVTRDLASADRALERITEEAALLAFGVAEDLVVAQAMDPVTEEPGAIVAHEGGRRRVLVEKPPGNGMARLHDLALLRGAPVAVVSQADDASHDPQSWAVHLLLVDVRSGTRTDLGVIAGWEEGIDDARLLADGGVVLLRQWILGANLERLAADGTSLWDTGSLWPEGGTWASMVLQGDEVLLLETSPPPDPAVLTVRRFDLATGREGAPSTVDLEPDAVGPLGGLCDEHAEPFADAFACTRHGHPAVVVSPVDGRVRQLAETADATVVTRWRTTAGEVPGR